MCFLLLSWVSMALAASEIPKAAWSRPIGLPLENPGVTKDPGLIDDGYWQGAPVGGMGAGTFSRSYRGDFSRWHIKAGVHKYETVYVNEFAMFQKSEGDPAGTARVLMTDHPRNGELASWAWDYPVGAGEYSALVSKILVRLQVGQIPCARGAGTIFARAPRQLPRIQLPGRSLPLACRESD